jgi:hypothetical protein
LLAYKSAQQVSTTVAAYPDAKARATTAANLAATVPTAAIEAAA